MDPGTWAVYGQHYSRLSGGVNTQAAHAQLNDLTLPGSLARQDALTGYGATGPPPPHSHPHASHSTLLLSHHGLNIGQTGHHADPSTFVNSANLLAPGYDQMLSASQFQGKGHLGHLNVAHPSTGIYKGVSKEPELTELRGGFARRGPMATSAASGQTSNSPGTHRGSPSDSPMAPPPAGIFNHQSPHAVPPPSSPSHHTWRHAGMVPGSTGPFGILPHEAFPHASVADVPDKHHNAPPYKSRSSSESQGVRYADPNIGSHHGSIAAPPSPVSPAGRGPPIMIQQGESDPAGLVLKPGEYPIYPSNMNVSRGIIPGNYVPQPHFSPQGLRAEGGEVYGNLGYCAGGPPQKMVSGMYSNVPVSTMVNPHQGAHSATYIQAPGSSRPPAVQSGQRPRSVHGPPQSPSNKQTYTPPGPYPSPQNYHMSGAHLQESLSASPALENYPSASGSPAGNIHPQTPHHPGPNFPMPSSTSLMTPSSDPNNHGVVYSSVITRAGTQDIAYKGQMPNDLGKGIAGQQDPMGSFKEQDMKHQSRGDFAMGHKQQEAPCMPVSGSAQPTDQPMKPMMAQNVVSGQQMQKIAAATDRNTPNTCIQQQQQHHQQQMSSPKEMGVDSIFDDPTMTLQDLADMAPTGDLSAVGMSMGMMGDEEDVGSDHRRHGTMMEALCGAMPIQQQQAMVQGQGMYRQDMYEHVHQPHVPQQEHSFVQKEVQEPVKCKRGRPRGKKNKKTEAAEAAAQEAMEQQMNSKSLKMRLPPKLCHLPTASVAKDAALTEMAPMLPKQTMLPEYPVSPHGHLQQQPQQVLPNLVEPVQLPAPMDQVPLPAGPQESLTQQNVQMVPRSPDLPPLIQNSAVKQLEPVANGSDMRKDVPVVSPAVEEPLRPPLPSIEDELGFLAHLPLDGQGAVTSRVRSSARKREKSVAVADYIGSYLKFLKGEKPIPVEPVVVQPDPPMPVVAVPEEKPAMVEINVMLPSALPKRGRHQKSEMGTGTQVASQRETNGMKKEKRVKETDTLAFSEDEDSNHVLTDSLQLALKSLSDNEAKDGANVGREETRKSREVEAAVPKEVGGKGKKRVREPKEPKEPKIQMKIPGRAAVVEQETEGFPHRKMSMRTCKQKAVQKHKEKMSKRRSRNAVDDSEGETSFEDAKGQVHQDASLTPVCTPTAEKQALSICAPTPPVIKMTVPAPMIPEPLQPSEESLEKFMKESSNRKRGRLRRSKNRAKSHAKSLNEPVVDSDDEPLLKRARPSMERKGKANNTVAGEVGEASKSGASKTGDFVICRRDKGKDKFPLWKIDEKNLLQKFEQFEENGRFLYKAMSIYTVWNTSHRPNYEFVNVRLVRIDKGNMVVEYVRDQKVASGEETTTDAAETGATIPKENFEVYIQTLISQALDSNFISEIIKENDEYFLTHVYEIDAVVCKKKQEMNKHLKWDPKLREFVEDFPELKVSKRPFSTEKSSCEVCRREASLRIVEFDGELYDHTTLKKRRCEQKLRLNERKAFLLCSKCCHAASAYSKVHHQKYNFYLKCVTKVGDLSATGESKESHIILEQCLQDLDWMNKLFMEMQSVWAKCSRVR